MDTIRREISFRAPIARVWAYLTEPDLLAQWLMPNTFSPVMGHEFTMDCPPGIGSGAPIQSVVTDLQPPAESRARLAYTWEIDRPLRRTLLEIDLHESGGMTHLTLVHSGWANLAPDEAHVLERHEMGWDHLLGTALRELVES